MRISDWSSDVCSADLFGSTPIATAAGRRPMAASRRAAGAARTASKGSTPFSKPRPPSSLPPGLSPTPLQAEDRCHAFERSEEHTSELQSLMRTSYAVFCLKKKKRLKTSSKKNTQRHMQQFLNT